MVTPLMQPQVVLESWLRHVPALEIWLRRAARDVDALTIEAVTDQCTVFRLQPSGSTITIEGPQPIEAPEG